MDHFEVLGMPKRAALDPVAVREAFQAASKTAHPDVGGDVEGFERLTRAHAVLANPVQRLQHLAELEFGKAPDAGGAITPDTMALFDTVGSALSSADDFLNRRAGASSAIAKALLAKDEAEVSAAVFTASGAVRGRKNAVVDGFAEIDAASGEEAWRMMGESARELAFLAKWEAQLGERMAGLVSG